MRPDTQLQQETASTWSSAQSLGSPFSAFSVVWDTGDGGRALRGGGEGGGAPG